MTKIALPSGILIAFEGIDGAGKTTQANRLREFLAAKGFDVLLTKEPTSGEFGRRLRESARSGRLPPEEELQLFLDDRRQHVRDLLLPGLRDGQIIIVDRYYFSTVAYQGARGLDPTDLMTRNESFAPRPDLLVVLDIEPRIGLSRVAGRGDIADLFEDEMALKKSREIFRSVRAPYALHLDANSTIDYLEVQIREALYFGSLRTRLCSSARDEGVDYCGHSHSGCCPWIRVGEGFERPLRAESARDLEAVIADESRTIRQRLEAIIASSSAD